MSLHRMLHHIFARSLAVMPVPTAQALIAPADTADRMSGRMPASSTAWITPAPKYAAGAPPPDSTTASPGTSVGSGLDDTLAVAVGILLAAAVALSAALSATLSAALSAALSAGLAAALSAAVPAVRVDLLAQRRVGAGQRVQV